MQVYIALSVLPINIMFLYHYSLTAVAASNCVARELAARYHMNTRNMRITARYCSKERGTKRENVRHGAFGTRDTLYLKQD
jgi:hypothetical protein